MTIPPYVYVIVVVVIIGVGYLRYYRSRSGGSSGSGAGLGVNLPDYQRDHQVPDRFLVHAFLAYYTGTGGDPAYSVDRAANTDHLADGWGLRDAAAVDRQLSSYERGECTPAFDLIRVIKLIRHAYGAGMVSEDESWRRSVHAAHRLRAEYPHWDAVHSDFQAGRDMWWRDVQRSSTPPGEFENYAERYAEAQQYVIQGRPLH